MKFYSILEGQTQDVLRRLLRLINKSNAKIGTAEDKIDDINTLIGNPTNPGAGTILKRIGTAETDVGTLKTTVGDADGGLVKSVAGINTAIGDEETANTILYRIKALEDAANGGGTETTPAEETEPGEGG